MLRALAVAALGDVLREWARTDQTYQARVHHLYFGDGLNSVALNPGAILDDGVADVLRGGPGRELIFADGNGVAPDTLLDPAGDELILDID